MPKTINTDSYEIKNYELTKDGFLKTWLVGGVPDKILSYDSGSRREIINKDSLFDHESVNSAVGTPITFNHPPCAINSSNYKEFSVGTIMQEYASDPDTGALVLSAIIHDCEMVNGILTGKNKYISAGYSAEKTLNCDGILEQTKREYNHFAVLDSDHIPRAGEESKLILLDDIVQKTQITDSIPPASNQINMDEIAERVELFSTWKSILESNNKAVDFNMDSQAIKRSVLSVFYPEKTMKMVKPENLDGFWLGFLTNHDGSEAGGDNFIQAALLKKEYKTPVSQQPQNFDSEVDAARDAFIKTMEGIKK